VTVTGRPRARRDPEIVSGQTLRSAELQQLRDLLTNDPLRAVQVLPAVATGDDFRSEFAVRGAGVGRMNFTFEGISTPFLLHTVQQVQDGGSVAMVNGDVLDEISLSNGAYPQRYGNRTGAELDFHMREGSRDSLQSHLSISAIDASTVVEGPLNAGRDGSWLVSVRKSYLDLLVTRLYPENNFSFGFFDMQGKVVRDLSPRHRVEAAVTTGRSHLEREPDILNSGNLRNASNRSTLGILTWRYVPGSRFVLTQRLAFGANTFLNTSRDGLELGDGDAHESLYRGDWSLGAAARVTCEGGGEARWSTSSQRDQRLVAGRPVVREDFSDTASALSGYLQARLAPAADASIVPGIRVDRRALTGETTASPWIQARWAVRPGWTLRAGGGVYRQEPGFAEVLGVRGTASLADERAYHADVGVEAAMSTATRWQVTVYDREDRDLLRLTDAETRVVNGGLVLSSAAGHYLNALDGHARGIEWMLQRHTPNGLSGWISYSLGFSRYRDHTTDESFWGDYDQRHTINMYGNYRVSDRLSLSARFRIGSNFPATGYWTERDGAFFVGDRRNTVRVPAYSRLDLRANRTYTWDRRRLTLFLEALNVYNRANTRFVPPAVNRRTFEATNMFEKMVPLVPSIGVLLEF